MILAGLALLGCGGADDEDGLEPRGLPGTPPTSSASETGEPATSTPGSSATPGNSATPSNSAILLVGQVYNPDDVYNTYVGVFPEVPEGQVSFDRFREFGNANAYTNAGYIFLEEDGVMQRFSVDENLQLVAGPRFSWQDFGVGAINTTSTVFISAQRAYTFLPELSVIIVWNPATMERTGAMTIVLPNRPAGMETFAYDGRVVGDKVFWNVFSGDWDSITAYPAVTLVVADANSNDEPVRIVEDSRCLPGGPSQLGGTGDYYVQAGGYFGYFLVYGTATGARTCTLRVRAGQAQFDPEYLLDYQSLLGSYVSESWFPVGGSQYITRAWDPAVPFPESSDDFYDNAAMRALLIDTEALTAVRYPALDAAKSIDGTPRVVDGVSYYQLSTTGYVANGNTDVVELHPEGIVNKFHLNGFLLGLERVR